MTSPDEEGLRSIDVLIENEKIGWVGSDSQPLPSADLPIDRTIDCSHHVVVPGFINTHHHFYQTLTRNLAAVQNAKLFDWLVYLYEIWRHIDEEAVYYSSLLAMGELLRTGCTSSTDHLYLYPKNVAGDFSALQFDAAEKIGMRFSPCRGSMSQSKKDGGLPPDSVVQDEDTILEDCLRVIEQFHDPDPMAMRKVILAPCSPFSVSERLMRQTADLARAYKVRLHTHLAETQDENAFCEKKYGLRPLALMERNGFVGDDVFFAHGVHFSDGELQVLLDTNTKIAHCPSSNMRLGSGICRVREMLKMGIGVSLAVDGSASNDSSDFLGEMRNALLLQRVTGGSDALTCQDVYRMATETGAEVLGLSGVGRIAPGYAADIAIFDIAKLEYAGSLSDPPAALLFAGFNHGTAYTICNGKVVVDGGELTGIDSEKIRRKGNNIAEELLKRANI